MQLDLSKGIDPARTPDDSFELYSVPSHERGAPEVTMGNEIGSNKLTVVPGTVLLCKINPRINRVWVVGNYSSHAKIASTEWIPFFPLSSIEPRYLAYFLRQDTIRDFLAGNASGVGGSLMRVRAATFRDFPFLLAPLVEQARIADALDELFSDLDASVAALERVREKLKLYRASVLKAAVEGALTAEWRKQHTHVETALALLKCILAERRKRWEEEQLRKFKENGELPFKNWKHRYMEPVTPDITNLPPLPKGWCWATFEQASLRVTVGHVGPMKDEYVESGIPFLRNQNVRENKFDPDGLLFISPEFHAKLAKSIIRPGDIAVVRSGSVGVSCVIPDIFQEANCADLVLIQKPLGILPHYGAYYLNSAAKPHIRRGQVGIALTHFNTKSVAALVVAIPPLAEQEAIVEAVEDQLSIIDHLEADLDTKMKSVMNLRQAILRHAFTGKLVLQDHDDQPASELLKRIMAEREAHAHEPTAVKRAAKKTNSGTGRHKRPVKQKEQVG